MLFDTVRCVMNAGLRVKMSVIYEIQKETTKAALMLVDGVTSSDLVDVLTIFRPLGLWRMDLKTGHVFWTRDVFEIYEMSYTHEPVNFVEMNSKFSSRRPVDPA